MTWYANNVYARRSEALEVALLKTFPESVYCVKELDSHPWWKPEIIHGLPEGGLLVVRPISNNDVSDYLHQWYGEPVASWENFADFGSSESPLVILPQILADDQEVDNDADEAVVYVMPPEGFLLYLRHIARRFCTPVIYYQCFMWGGDVDLEFAFVYSGNDELLYSFVGHVRQVSRIEIRRNSATPTVVEGDVLTYALRHIGIELPSPYFALHTRSFDWGRYRIDKAT